MFGCSKNFFIVLIFLNLFNVNKIYADWLTDINNHPYFITVSIKSETLLVLPNLENIDVNNLDKLAKTFCFYGTYEGFNKVKIIDPIEYMETGNLNAHIEIEC